MIFAKTVNYGLIGAIIGIVIVVILVIVLICVKVSGTHRVNNTWQNRIKILSSNTARFNEEITKENFQIDFSTSAKAYHHTSSLHEIFKLCVDYTKKMVAICSLESSPYKSYFIKFDELKSIEILNGVQNSSSQSFSSGAAIGSYGLASGISSTDTYTEVTMSNVRLKIETTDPYKPGYVITMFQYQVDTSSDMYKILLNCIEDVRSVLNKIIEANQK